jgi:repressor LexA
MDKNYSQIVEEIKTKRKQLNLSYQDLSNRTGKKISKSTLQRYETGAIKSMPFDKLKIIAKALDIPDYILMGWPGDNWYKENAIPVKNNHLVPVFGTIPAGPPMLAVQDIECYEAADVENPLDYFYLRVKGDSMINANIMSGSLVLIKKQNCAEDGNIVACIVNGDEATLKRYKKVGHTILLMPENNKYQPIIVNADDFKNGYAYILGVATEVKFKL